MMAPLRKCIATVALSGTLPEKLEAAAAVGFDGVEIMEADLLSFDGSPADVRRIADSLGLGVDLHQPFRDFEAMPDRARNLGRAERKFDVMGALGAPVLPMPENYCDDLAARWGLDDAALAGLQRHALLYDDDDGAGRFWHLYTGEFWERFFFEVVQRSDGYAGFSAANTPVRAAAQARQHLAAALLMVPMPEVQP